MDLDRFWALIGAGTKNCHGSRETFLAQLRRELSKLDPESLRGFKSRLEGLIDAAYTWDLWGAAYIMNGGCSDDMFEYGRAWLVAQGRGVDEAALANAESLADASYAFGEPGEFECEELLYLPLDVYEERTGEEMEHEVGRTRGGGEVEPAGERWEEDADDLERRFPMLSARFG